MEVLDGGSGFSTEPTIQVFSQNGGFGATFSSTLKRKSLTVGDTVSVQNKSTSAKILAVDTRASTIELLVTSGTFLKDDVLLSSDGKTYGTVVEVNTAKAYAKSNSFGQIKEKFVGSAGERGRRRRAANHESVGQLLQAAHAFEPYLKVH